MASTDQPSKIPRLLERAEKPKSPALTATTAAATGGSPSGIPRRLGSATPLSPSSSPTPKAVTQAQLSNIPRLPEHVRKSRSLVPVPIAAAATSVLPSGILRRADRAAQPSVPSTPTPKAVAQAQSSNIPRRADHTDRPITAKSTYKAIKETPQGSGRSSVEPQLEIKTPGPTMSNDNSNVNTVAGSVHTLNNNNNNIITNIYGPVPNKSDAVQVKICADLMPRYVPQALYDAQLGSGCMEGTRVKIINDIIDWIKDQSAQKIFWLTGWAGTGKSAIAWTVCSRSRNDPEVLLGGSFFFSRSASSAAQRDVRCMIPTLAQILARQSDRFSQALADELTHDPDVLHKQISFQVEALLARPLRALASSRVAIVFVIDALDECADHSNGGGDLDDAGRNHIVSEMLEALVALFNTDAELPVKFLVTSRPDTHIRDTPVSDHTLSKILRLQTVDKEQVTKDIRLFIAAKLLSTPKLRTRFTDSDADMLAQQCDGLFIVATTALKYTFELGHDAAVTRFGTILNASRSGLSARAVAPLDRMYTLILEDAARMDEPGSDGLAAMLQLLAVLLSTRMALSVAALADLLGRPTDDARATLSRLHCVVHVPEDDVEPGLRTLHASFGDYVSHRAPGGVRMSNSNSHEVSARAAVRVMAERLHFNISQSRSSYEPNAPTMPSGITPSLQYACTQWVYHIASLQDPSALNETLRDIFCPRFLFWLEVMSVLGQVQRAAAMLHFIGVTIMTPELSQFFRDANSFVVSSREAIERSAPHIYISALPFANKNAEIYKAFASLYIGLAFVDVFGFGPHGGPLIMTLTGKESGLTSLAYSAGGQFLASGSKNGAVCIWDTRSGEETIGPLYGRNGGVTCLAFSPNGTNIVAGTDTGTVCIWTLVVGQSTMQQLIGHSQSVVSVAISSDSRLVASASYDKTVRAWRMETGQLLTVFTGHDDPNKGIAISADGEVTASGLHYDSGIQRSTTGPSGTGNVRVSKTGRSMVWFTGQRICLWTQQNQDTPSLTYLEGHTGPVASAVISPNSSYVASAAEDGTICIWDVGVRKEPVQSASVILSPPGLQPWRQAMSRDGANIVSMSTDASLRVWNAETGETRLPPLLKDIHSLTISSEGHRIVTESKGTLKLWELHTGAAFSAAGNTDDRINRDYGKCWSNLTLTPDARFLAVAVFVQVTRHQLSRSFPFPFLHSPLAPTLATALALAFAIARAPVPESTLAPMPVLLPPFQGLPEAMVEPKAGSILGWMVLFVDIGQIQSRHLSDILLSLTAHLEYSDIRLYNTQQKATVDISLDGKFVALAVGADAIHLWQINPELEALRSLRTAASVKSIRFSPDSTHIASGCSDNTGRIWNISTGQLVFELAGHTGSVTACIHSPDGMHIATASEDKSVRLWDGKTGVHCATLFGHRASVELLGFADNGSLVSCSTDGTISVWDVNAARSLPPENTDESFLALFTATLKDGWLKGPSGELLLWVPAEYRSHLRMSPCTHRIADKLVSVKTSSVGWHRGQNWTSCWLGGELNTVFDSDTV